MFKEIFNFKCSKTLLYSVISVLLIIFSAMYCAYHISRLQYEHKIWYSKTVDVKARVLDTTGAGFNSYKKTIVEVMEIEGIPSRGRIIVENIENLTPVRYGDIVLIKGNLVEPDRKSNPGGFDYRIYLWTKGISSILYAVKIQETGLTKKSALIALAILLRSKLSKAIDSFADNKEAMLLKRILVADRSGIDENEWKKLERNFREVGLSHIIAVSGSHINMIVMPLCFLLARLGLKRKTVNIALISILIIYLPLVGFPPSATRAVISSVITLIGQLVFKDSDLLTSISASSCIILFNNPLSVIDPGFQLSFAATLSIFLYYNCIKRFFFKSGFSSRNSEFLALPFSAQVGINPLAMYWFGRVSLVSIPMNLLAFSFVAVLMASGFLASLLWYIFTPIARIFGVAANFSTKLLIILAEILSKVPFASINTGSPYLITLLLSITFIICFYFLAGRKLSIKITALIISFIMPFTLITAQNLLNKKELTVTFFDVGHGDSILIKTPNGKTVLIDSGAEGKGYNVVLPYLAHKGINKLDISILTHYHEDHYGGFAEIISNIEPGVFCLPFKNYDFDICSDDAVELKYGNIIELDTNIKITILSPNINDFENNNFYNINSNSNPNNLSIVALLTYNEVSFLFTGDIEEEVEEIIIPYIAAIGGADILKVAHHGSNTSSTEEFINTVNPSIAVVSTGKGNDSNFSKEVEQRLTDSEIETYRTDTNGAVTVSSDGVVIKVKTTLK